MQAQINSDPAYQNIDYIKIDTSTKKDQDIYQTLLLAALKINMPYQQFINSDDFKVKIPLFLADHPDYDMPTTDELLVSFQTLKNVAVNKGIIGNSNVELVEAPINVTDRIATLNAKSTKKPENRIVLRSGVTSSSVPVLDNKKLSPSQIAISMQANALLDKIDDLIDQMESLMKPYKIYPKAGTKGFASGLGSRKSDAISTIAISVPQNITAEYEVLARQYIQAIENYIKLFGKVVNDNGKLRIVDINDKADAIIYEDDLFQLIERKKGISASMQDASIKLPEGNFSMVQILSMIDPTYSDIN